MSQHKAPEASEVDDEGGLPGYCAKAPSAFMREVAKIALVRGDTLGEIARARGSDLTHMISGHFKSQRPHAATRAWYAQRYEIDKAYEALIEGRGLKKDDLDLVNSMIERYYGTNRFEKGTLEALRAVRVEHPDVYRKALEAFALERYRSSRGLHKGTGMHGTEMVRIAPAWTGRAEDVAFADALLPQLDLRARSRMVTPVEGVLSGIASRLHDGGCTDAQIDSVIEIVRPMLREKGHDLTIAEAALAETLAILRDPKRGRKKS
jgi:hypothetical protein